MTRALRWGCAQVIQGELDDAVPRTQAVRIVERLRARPAASSADASSSEWTTTGADAGSTAPVTEYVELSRVGHIPMEEAASAVADAVTSFVERWMATSGPASRGRAPQTASVRETKRWQPLQA
jgi:hypothetical protein